MSYRSRDSKKWKNGLFIVLGLVFVLGLIGAIIYLSKQKSKKDDDDLVVITNPAPAPSQDHPVLIEPPSDNGAIDLDEANYGPVLATKPFPTGFVPGPSASPCIVARYLLDLPGMPSFIPQERLPWTYEERLVLEAFEELCNDDDMVKTIRLQGGFGFFAYIIDKNSVPYNRYFVLFYLPKLGWQLGRCIPPNNVVDPTPTQACINFIGDTDDPKPPGRPAITSVEQGPDEGSITIFFVATGDDAAAITNFIVTANPNPGKSVNGTQSPIIFDGLDCNPPVAYEFRVTAQNPDGTSVPSQPSDSIFPQCTTTTTTVAPTTVAP